MLITGSKCGSVERLINLWLEGGFSYALINGFPEVLCYTLHFNRKCWQKLFCNKCYDEAIKANSKFWKELYTVAALTPLGGGLGQRLLIPQQLSTV
jgi:hypothetical protein